VREHRKKQKVHADAAAPADSVAEGASTALATQSTGTGLVFGRTVLPSNAQLFNGCVYKALTDPLPVDHLVAYPELSVMRQREVLFQCKQKVPLLDLVCLLLLFADFALMCVSVMQLAYEEQLLDRRYWKELQTASQGVVSIQSAYDNLLQQKEELEAKLVRAEEEAGRRVAQAEERANTYAREAEEKAKAAVASEAARIQAEFDKRLEAAVDKARSEAVLAYRRDRGRAVEQTTAFIEGGVYILGKIKDAFPDQDWSQLPVPAVTDDLVDDEHTAILHEIEEEISCSSVQG
jgi:F0F1-type ATP synthase membrane subunit b/b'